MRQEAIWAIKDIYNNKDHVDHVELIRGIKHNNRFLRKIVSNKLKNLKFALQGLFK